MPKFTNEQLEEFNQTTSLVEDIILSYGERWQQFMRREYAAELTPEAVKKAYLQECKSFINMLAGEV